MTEKAYPLLQEKLQPRFANAIANAVIRRLSNRELKMVRLIMVADAEGRDMRLNPNKLEHMITLDLAARTLTREQLVGIRGIGQKARGDFLRLLEEHELNLRE